MTIKWSRQIENNLTEEQVIENIIFLYEVGNSLSILGKHYKVHPTSVRNLLKKHNIQMRLRGGKNYYKPLVIPRKEFYNSTYRILAKKYNVSTSTINNYRVQKGWKKGD